MDPFIGRFIGEVKQTLTHQAEDAMTLPKADPFEHGVVAGEYRGLQRALNILENLLRDTDEKEKLS